MRAQTETVYDGDRHALTVLVEEGAEDGICDQCGAWLDDTAHVTHSSGFGFHARCGYCGHEMFINRP